MVRGPLPYSGHACTQVSFCTRSACAYLARALLESPRPRFFARLSKFARAASAVQAPVPLEGAFSPRDLQLGFLTAHSALSPFRWDDSARAFRARHRGWREGGRGHPQSGLQGQRHPHDPDPSCKACQDPQQRRISHYSWPVFAAHAQSEAASAFCATLQFGSMPHREQTLHHAQVRPGSRDVTMGNATPNILILRNRTP